MNIKAEKSQRQKAFEDYRKDYTQKDIEMERLYLTRLIQDSSEKTRANTSVMVWVIVIGVALSIVSAFLI